MRRHSLLGRTWGVACLMAVTLLASSAVAADGGVPDAPGTATQWSPIGAPAFTPELGLLVAAGGAVSFTGDAKAPDIRRSSGTLVAGLSTVGAFFAQGRLTGFFKDDGLRVTLALDGRDMPDHFFGVGYQAARTTAESPSATLWRRHWWQLTQTTLSRAAKGFYLGTVVDTAVTAGRELSQGVANHPLVRRQGASNLNVGLGLTLQYDSRDVPINAYRGALLSLTWLGYAPILSSTSNFQTVALDYRQYVTLRRPGSTLAWQVKYRTVLGDAPWTELSMVGTPWDLRAYRWGRYRDRTAATAVAEYRFMFPAGADSLLGRLGVALWAGVGALGSTPVPDVRALLPAIGMGLRLELQQRITLRLDVGFGLESRVVYFNFLEAF